MASSPESTGSKQAETQFKPGQSGNPKGRPKGSRNKLCEAFLDDMQADWAEHGKEAITSVRTDKPDVYLKVVASILPKDMNLNINPLEDAKDDELIQRLRDLDGIIRPFLGPEGGSGDSGGTEAPTTIQ